LGTDLCARCGALCPPGSRFCSQCGASLEVDKGPARERKVVTCLFCDLVGFTALAERSDPEDVDRVLRQYAAVASRAVESYGGRIEKFIGDAVVAVFGVPAAHEDDAERAVHAALRIRAGIVGIIGPDGRPLSIRIGINTGEVLARPQALSASGEGFMSGDAVNTAARLQAAAPPQEVLVGPSTYALTSRVFDYSELAPMELKGKTQPVGVWLVHSAISRTGVHLSPGLATPFVGRSEELARLDGLLRTAIDTRTLRLGLVTGEPGIGKSRLLIELYRRLDRRPETVAWRQGRCLPYGEGVSFTAISQIVTAHAGILEHDSPAVADGKLCRAVDEGGDREWIIAALRPLAGLGTSLAAQQERFSAWTRFLARLAERRPLVLVIEDLHWADEMMLDFVRQLAGADLQAPLLLLLTARTQFLHDHPEFLGSVPPSGRLALEPLEPGETARLVADLVRVEELEEDHQTDVLTHCGGNPLYAEELVRLLKDRQRLPASLTDPSARQTDAEVPVPPSLHAVIASRVDALDLRLKALLSDAAVVGLHFSSDAIAALAGSGEQPPMEKMTELVGLGLLRVTSGGGDRREFAFWHSLTREVVYRQLPRDDRGAKHQLLAQWFEASGEQRSERSVEVTAYHYRTALDLFRSVGDEGRAQRLVEPTRRFLSLAGEQVLSLNPAAAVRHLEGALQLCAPHDPVWSQLTLRYSEALRYDGRLIEAEQQLLPLVRSSIERGDTHVASTASVQLAQAYWLLSDGRAAEYSEQALALSASHAPSPEMVEVLEHWAKACVTKGAWQEAVQAADKALLMSRQVGMGERWQALHYRGMARCSLGDVKGLGDYWRALEVAAAEGLGHQLAGLQVNLSEELFATNGPSPALELLQEGVDTATRRGDALAIGFLRAAIMQEHMWAGLWGQSLAEAEALDGLLDERGQVLYLQSVRAYRSLLLTLRGRAKDGLELAEWAETASRPFALNRLECLAPLAAAYAALGRKSSALELLHVLADTDDTLRSSDVFAKAVTTAIRTAAAAHDRGLIAALAHLPGKRPFDSNVGVWARAVLAEEEGALDRARHLFADAAGRWRECGIPYEEAQASWGEGRCLAALRRWPVAEARLQAARETFMRLGAMPDIIGVDRLRAECSGHVVR
jgi:class 3 adenylate cyclase/tetratricopeptide (TPR) repeat protein